MNTLKSTILASALLLGGLATVSAQTTDDIFAKHYAAVGGDNWNKITSLKTIGVMNTQGMEIQMTNTVIPSKASRSDITVMGTNGYSIVTEKEGWSFMPMMGQTAPEQMKAEDLKTSQSELDVKAKNHVDVKANVTKAELVGKEKMGGVDCFKVKVTDKNNEEETLYFDATTYYLVAVKGKVSAQGQEVEVTQNFSDFQKLDGGIVMAMKVEVAGQGDLTLKTVEVNKPIDESVFKPAK